ncbi:MAG: phosphate ABC transporter substrate-binding/OmpA family protein [Corallincola sp.]|nr:phosphate ABC transporter substrate-binding/OmpA family protein [Corallincola sp.]
MAQSGPDKSLATDHLKLSQKNRLLLLDKLVVLERLAKSEFDIRILHQKMMQDAHYFDLVITELSALQHPGLTTVIAEINLLLSSDDDTPVAQPVAKASNKRWLASAAMVDVVMVAVLLWLLLPQLTAAPTLSAQPRLAEQPVVTASDVQSNGTALAAPALLPVSKPEIAFRLHGSNTIGEKLAPALIEAYLKSIGITEMSWVKGAVAVERQLQFVDNGVVKAIELHAHGSSTAFEDMLGGKADIGMASRAIKGDELTALKPIAGDLSRVGNEHIVGLDGLAVIVNENNSVSRLPVETLARIFAGEISNWSEVGGTDAPIKVIARDEHSGTWDTFKDLVLKKFDKSLAANATRIESSSELSRLVAADETAIGFIGLNYVGHAKALAIAESPETSAIFPTRFTVGTEDYALSRRLYLYTPTAASDFVKDFARFAIDRQGQEIVQETGLISQNLRAEKVQPPQNAPAGYRQYAQNGERLSLNFRFAKGTGELDNKGKHDLERLIEFVEQNNGRQLVLMGFADASGSPQRNAELALERAKAVEAELEARGITVTAVDSYGQELPVANNASESGRARNRRVEVWVL